jgi:L-lactate permease
MSTLAIVCIATIVALAGLSVALAMVGGPEAASLPGAFAVVIAVVFGAWQFASRESDRYAAASARGVQQVESAQRDYYREHHRFAEDIATSLPIAVVRRAEDYNVTVRVDAAAQTLVIIEDGRSVLQLRGDGVVAR